MTENISPNQPLPEHVMIVDDDGMPSAVMNADIIQNAATRLMYEMACNSGDEAALSAVSKKYLDEVGVDTFGYVTAAALKLMTAYILEPTLETCDLAGIKLRDGLARAGADAIRDLS